jgi:hypothetical protein
MTALDATPRWTNGATRIFSVLRSAVVISLTILSSSCVISKQSLFDPQQAATPVAGGNFAEEYNKDGQWVRNATVKLVQNGRAYRLESEKDGKTYKYDLAFYDVGSGFYVGVTAGDPSPVPKNRSFIYVLLDKRNEGFVYYEPVCSDFQFVRLPRELWPLIDGGNCVYDNREKLVQALLAYASVSEPNRRYVPLKP